MTLLKIVLLKNNLKFKTKSNNILKNPTPIKDQFTNPDMTVSKITKDLINILYKKRLKKIILHFNISTKSTKKCFHLQVRKTIRLMTLENN